jgi:hypothetical protein
VGSAIAGRATTGATSTAGRAMTGAGTATVDRVTSGVAIATVEIAGSAKHPAAAALSTSAMTRVAAATITANEAERSGPQSRGRLKRAGRGHSSAGRAESGGRHSDHGRAQSKIGKATSRHDVGVGGCGRRSPTSPFLCFRGGRSPVSSNGRYPPHRRNTPRRSP